MPAPKLHGTEDQFESSRAAAERLSSSDPGSVNQPETKEFQDWAQKQIAALIAQIEALEQTVSTESPQQRHQERPISDSMTSGEVDAKIAASEAKIDTKFAELRGDLRVLTTELSNMRGIKTTVIGSAIGVTALILGVLAFGNDRFSVGMDATSTANQAAQRALELALPRQSLGTVDSTVVPKVDPAQAN